MADTDTTTSTTTTPNSEPTTLAPSTPNAETSPSTPDLSAKILKQVDYYFSDSNYPKDKFLRTRAKQNPHGYIPVDVLTTFNRLKELTTDVGVIAHALKSSTMVELNDDSTMLRRINPLPEDDTSLPRSIYSRGWAPDTTIEKVAEFFAPYGKVLSVRLRKDKPTKAFKVYNAHPQKDLFITNIRVLLQLNSLQRMKQRLLLQQHPSLKAWNSLIVQRRSGLNASGSFTRKQ
jgi:hypothetical protein